MPKISSLSEIARRYKRVLVFGAGGGGDGLGAFIVWRRLRSLGADALLGSVVWERFQVDPFPGPIPVESLAGGEAIGWTAALVDGETVAIRYGATVRPQIARIAGIIGERTVYLDLSKGAEGLLMGLESVREELGVEAFVGVDTGGDILALGCEEGLWSPLADALSLYALSRTEADSYITVLGPGADGELSPDTVLRYIADIARREGLIEVFGLSREDYLEARKLEPNVVSEASKIPLRAFEGKHGTLRIRGGTRTVRVTPLQATAYLLDARIVAGRSPLPGLVEGTRGISQASQALNEACIVTELDLEQELSRLRETGGSRPESLNDIRRRLRRALMSEGCRPLPCSEA